MPPPDFPPGGYLPDYLGFWAVWLVLVLVTVWAFRRRRAAGSGRGRLVVVNLLVFACLVWTVVLAAETYLRYVYDATDSYGLTLTNRAWFRRHFRVNSKGLRDREFEAVKRPGVARVECIGDSFTFGYGVAEMSDTWPQRLGAALDAKSPGRYEVRNYGFIGIDTGLEADVVEELVATTAPDHVILGYCLNDTDDLLPPEKRFDREAIVRPAWIASWRSFLADFLWFRLDLYGDPRVSGYFDWVKEAYDDPQLFGAQTERFRRIADTCRKANVRLDVVVFPLFSNWGEHYQFDSCHDRVADAWKKVGVGVIDLREAYRGIPGTDLVVNRFDAHPNERAHEIAAHEILNRVFGAR